MYNYAFIDNSAAIGLSFIRNTQLIFWRNITIIHNV